MKYAGLAAVAVQAGDLVGAGYGAGSNKKSYNGWESFNPSTMFFNREPFRIESPSHKPVGEVKQPSHLTDYVFGRVAMIQKALQENTEWVIGNPVDELPLSPPVIAFYAEYP